MADTISNPTTLNEPMREGQVVSAKKLDRLARNANQIKSGINPGRQVFPPRASGGGDTDYADVASTTGQQDLTGTPLIDTFQIVAGSVVLAWQQTNPAQNGRYEVPEGGGTWKKLDQPRTVGVFYGNKYKLKWFFLTNVPVAGTYEVAGGGSTIEMADVATTANHQLSGTANVDGISKTFYSRVLVWKQTDATQNGLYSVSSTGVWTKLGVPDVVIVRWGTANNRLIYMQLLNNAYIANQAVFA